MAWSFRKRGGACTACDRSFEDGERHASRLAMHEEELARQDFCGTCWEGRGEPEGELFWWFTSHHEDAKKTLKLDMEALEGLFTALEGQKSRTAKELRYLLCLLLMRKRRLKLIKIRRGGDGEALILRRPRRQEEIAVFVFDFGPDRIDALRQKLQDVFDGIEAETGLDQLVVDSPEGDGAEGSDASGDADEPASDEPKGSDAPVGEEPAPGDAEPAVPASEGGEERS